MWVAIHLYKNILFYTMLIGAVTRLISAGMLAMMGKINLPVELVVLSLAIAFFGFVLVVKRQVFSIKLSEVVAYHVAADLSAMASMVALHFYAVDISLIETLITGSVLSVLVSAALLFLTFRRKRYITIRQRREEQGEAAPSKTVSVPAKQ